MPKHWPSFPLRLNSQEWDSEIKWKAHLASQALSKLCLFLGGRGTGGVTLCPRGSSPAPVLCLGVLYYGVWGERPASALKVGLGDRDGEAGGGENGRVGVS